MIQCGAPMKDEVIAILHLREKEPVLTAASFAFAFFEEGSQRGQPFLAAAEQIVCSQGIGQFLKLLRMTAFEECIGTLFKIDAFGAHVVGQPVVLIEADAC